jgi:hypothetical protein
MLNVIALYIWGWCGCEIGKRTVFKKEYGPCVAGESPGDVVEKSVQEKQWQWISFAVLALMGPVGLILLLAGYGDVKVWWDRLV